MGASISGCFFVRKEERGCRNKSNDGRPPFTIYYITLGYQPLLYTISLHLDHLEFLKALSIKGGVLQPQPTKALDLVKAAQAKDAFAAHPELNFLALALSGKKVPLVGQDVATAPQIW